MMFQEDSSVVWRINAEGIRRTDSSVRLEAESYALSLPDYKVIKLSKVHEEIRKKNKQATCKIQPELEK